MLVFCAVIAVPGKSVQLIDQDDIEGHCGGVSDHHLELRTLIGAAGHSAIRISVENGDIVPAGVVLTNAQLAFYGLLALPIGRISCIYDGLCGLFFFCFRHKKSLLLWHWEAL